MFVRYLSDMKSWIIFFITLLGLANLIIYLDHDISVRFTSLIYLDTLMLISFGLFLIWRYKKEMEFINSIAPIIQKMEADWIEILPTPSYLRDEIINEILRTADKSFKNTLSQSNKMRIIEHDYITSWTHEIKTPLTAMKLLIDSNQSNPVLRKIEAEWLRIHLLIDRQLYISRLPSLESDYVLKKTNIKQLIIKEVQELAPWCLEKNIAIDLDNCDKEVVTDSRWCRFIIRQILTNAIKHSPKGKTITIFAQIFSDKNISLIIQDEGPGILKQDLPRIFDKGFTGSTGRLQNAATGLGLYLAHVVSTKIGIMLTATSEKNQGATFYMTFTAENEFDSVQT